MRTLAACALVAAAALTGCAGSDDGRAATREPVPSSSPSPDPAQPDQPTDLAATEVCDLVRQGIDAFNVGDLEGTVARFAEAVPLAEDLARDQPSEDTATLLDAVVYYAELPVEDYVEASVGSPQFLRFKAFTLTECAYAGSPAGPTDPAVPA